MSVDKYFDKEFNGTNAKRYDCLNFARDVWLDIKGIDLAIKLQGAFGPPSGRTPRRQFFREFQKISKPQDPCLVLFERPRAAPHIGVFIRGRVLHLKETGVQFQPLDVISFQFKTVRFYV
jgi:hypothetical protein